MFKGYNFTEAVIGGSRFLYHELSAGPVQPEHRAIIRKNPDKLHIVPYSHQSPDGNENACYELGEAHHGLISLEHVFHARRPVKMEELILLMHGIVSTIVAAKRLGLYENSFVLEPRYIFMKRNSTRPLLIYLPMQLETTLKSGVSSLVKYLSGAFDPSNPLTKQIIVGLRNIALGDCSLHDMAKIVVQAANHQTVDKKYLLPPEKKPDIPAPAALPVAPMQPGESKPNFFRRWFGAFSKQAEAYEDPFEDIDERTMLDLTDASEIGMNVAVLYFVEGNENVMQIPVTKDNFVLGRKREEVDFCFDGENDKGISRVHAAIIFDGNDYYITDKGSSGGTYVNERRIAPGQPTKIESGAKIRLYTKKLVFECSGAAK